MTSILGLALPQEYGYVVIATAGTFFLSFWHGARIGSFRKAAGIGYPKAYADSSDLSTAEPEKKKAMYLFNCAQRAHSNYLENQPSFSIAMLVAGIQYPIATSVMGAGWLVSRVIYAVGYTREDKTKGEGRLYGAPFWLFQLGVFGLTAWTGIKMVL
ncbi:hypothetical protein LTR36_001796 [Oleoguttula mirabilis]|uniref:Microsomal glutathione S-transferase 3 n=1 Tax=Oleoguttula mirabilis TaxID=1507867 RepID=A0AAV9JNN9_9PEZI|nr:hypothetical protein LTR36_001796 [Oleoguttula mirabilis]